MCSKVTVVELFTCSPAVGVSFTLDGGCEVRCSACTGFNKSLKSGGVEITRD